MYVSMKGVKCKRQKGWMKDFIETCIEAALLAVVLFFLCWPVKIDGLSMENTLTTGDRVLISRFSVMFNQFENGDILVCKITENGHTTNIIKRLVGKPHDEIVIENGKVFRNGEVLYEPYANSSFTAGQVKMVLGEDEFFFLGDNRLTSKDSRMFGVLSKKQLVGKVYAQIYPFSKVGFFYAQ